MTELNLQIEPLVREAFAAAIGSDPARSMNALQAMADSGLDTVRDCIALAGTVATVALFDLFNGQKPTDNELGELAEQLTEMEAWAQFEGTAARDLLSVVAMREDVPELPNDSYMRLIFVAGAWLLASFGPMERTWFDYLDEILARIELEQSLKDAGPGGRSQK